MLQLFSLISGVLVMWMAAGFAMLEAGMVQTKSVAEILIKNVALYAIACIMYMFMGYNIMYGSGSAWIPQVSFFLGNDHSIAQVTNSTGDLNHSYMADFFFQVVFVATAMSSVRGDYSCMDCHADIEKLPHRKGDLDVVDCVSCYLQQGDGSSPSRRKWLAQDTIDIVVQTKSYTHSIHARDSDKDNADCADCHTAHYVYPSDDTRSSAHKLNAPETCGHCHAEALDEYRNSIHGASLKTPWKGDSATCTDCHSAHQIDEKEGTKAHRVVTEQCESCHEREVKSYMATTHGQLAWLGNKDVARCHHCHQPHTTHAVDDPKSMVYKSNIQKTCGECHEDAGESFTNFRAHSDISDYERNPELWWVSRIMVAIGILTLIFFYSHSMLWFWREMKSRPITWAKVDGRNYPVRAKHVKHDSGKHFQRFSWQWRLNHWALALSVMTLVFTGMAVMYPGTAWAMATVKLFGGWQTFGYIHHTAAVVFLLAVFGHAVVIVFRLVLKGGFQWFGPDSLLPRKISTRKQKRKG